ncbi:MAG: response regulator transcription factor [Burkholderiales bacterium]|nr:response regulator transcription factor [Burkholderiales bacterium]
MSATPAKSGCVLLADRHHGLTEGLRGLLGTRFDKVFMVTDEASAVEGAQRLLPALIVVELGLVPGDAAGLVRRLRAVAGSAKLLLLSVHDEASVARAALDAGADGVVLERLVATDLLPGVEHVLGGATFLSRPLRGHTAK